MTFSRFPEPCWVSGRPRKSLAPVRVADLLLSRYGLRPVEQPIQKDPERVDIGGLVDRFAAHLLRTREFRGEHAGPRNCLTRTADGGEEVGDAKVEQLWNAFSVHEDVGRFDVTMNDLMIGVRAVTAEQTVRNRIRRSRMDSLLVSQ